MKALSSGADNLNTLHMLLSFLLTKASANMLKTNLKELNFPNLERSFEIWHQDVARG
jgi:hypothetical protein